jgi:hypothetical protein
MVNVSDHRTKQLRNHRIIMKFDVWGFFVDVARKLLFTYMKVEVKVTLQKATKAHRGSSDMAVLFL